MGAPPSAVEDGRLEIGDGSAAESPEESALCAILSSIFDLPSSAIFFPKGLSSEKISHTPYQRDFFKDLQNFFETPSTLTKTSWSEVEEDGRAASPPEDGIWGAPPPAVEDGRLDIGDGDIPFFLSAIYQLQSSPPRCGGVCWR